MKVARFIIGWDNFVVDLEWRHQPHLPALHILKSVYRFFIMNHMILILLYLLNSSYHIFLNQV